MEKLTDPVVQKDKWKEFAKIYGLTLLVSLAASIYWQDYSIVGTAVPGSEHPVFACPDDAFAGTTKKLVSIFTAR